MKSLVVRRLNDYWWSQATRETSSASLQYVMLLSNHSFMQHMKRHHSERGTKLANQKNCMMITDYYALRPRPSIHPSCPMSSWDPTPVCGLQTCSICTVVHSDMQLIADSLVITIHAAQLWQELRGTLIIGIVRWSVPCLWSSN